MYSNPEYNHMANEDVHQDLFDNLNIPKITDDEKQNLEKPFSKQEIFDVIKSMKLNKTPGFDGLPIEFYIVLWTDICDM